MRKILLIGMDAAEHTLIQKWGREGSLPNLGKLLGQGAFGLMESFARYLTGSLWYSFYLGQQPGTHGLYSYSSWRPDTMKSITPSSKWLKLTPFWHLFQRKDGPKGVILNVPSAFTLLPFHGVELMSLASDHSLTPLQSFPADVARKVTDEFGHIIFPEEPYKLLSFKEFIEIRDELIEITHKLKDIYLRMMDDESWNLFLAVFTTIHRAGHRLWSTTNIYDLVTESQKREALAALKQVYQVCDQAIGELMEKAGPEVITMVFSFYGMHDNHSREFILPEMLNRILHAQTPQEHVEQPAGLLSKIRERIPLPIRHSVKAMLPAVWRQKLTIFWRLGQLDWKKTRAFMIPLEVRIGIRINLKGREAQGVVLPGREYEELCQKIISGLHTFVDADTGKPLVQDMQLAKDIFKGSRVSWLPDLLGSWSDEPASHHRLITSPLYGDIAWPTPGHNPEGRSGNHTNEGFLIAHGKGIRTTAIQDANILDIAPTILSILGEPIPPEMEGRILPIFDESII